MNIVQSDGSVLAVQFTDVLHSPSMFVSLISHSKLRAKGLYFHGKHQALLRETGDSEIAFCPEIDGVSNFLEADESTDAARKLAFAATYASSSFALPKRNVTLHDTYGHASVEGL
ncbi:hypothetical protein EJ04DRAFT_571347 [Polyplosphaeria fusca]|uniref:Uncharacterized protein n=1 Tax=Polyplosphaeria fusca TaxID=682080 RepID=A0A9P4US58_9PLEO|nr:hypothetical protein EJ04DRAFT_571347 [Polyplosphaeria fusca]